MFLRTTARMAGSVCVFHQQLLHNIKETCCGRNNSTEVTEAKRKVISKSNPHVLAVRAENMEADMSAASWSRQNTFCTKCEVCKYIQAIGKEDLARLKKLLVIR